MEKLKTVLVVDDEENIVMALEAYLTKFGYHVITANCGRTAIDLFYKAAPDIIVLDLMMPDMTGEEVCKNIRLKSRVPIIMLTAKVEEHHILNGLGLGADDYITKPFSLKELSARMEAVLRRTSTDAIPLSNELAFDDGNIVVDSMRYEVRKNEKVIILTPHEFKILMTMAKYPSKVFTREELINLVMGEDFNGYDRAIDNHIKNIRIKIEDDSKNPRYIITVHGIGYKFGK
ncbi:MAG: response regulator transcription factor [Eubacteriaceae bacterium]|nr:response regulator transcription factor [Eubacteriaceae bacterium]